MNHDVIALGELLIDFTQNGISSQGNLMFEANPGGAPGNVLAMLGKLGHPTAFIGKVGNDRFGQLLRDALTEQGIDTAGLCVDDHVPTTLALVHKLPDGDRDFSFYRTPGADMMLTADEVSEEMIAGARLFHFGTLSMTDEPVRSATIRAVELAEKHGLLISFDPNLRPPLWKRDEDARAAFDFGMRHCSVMKISDNEIVWYTGCEDMDEGIARIRAEYPNIRLLLASLGPDGSRAYLGDRMVEQTAFLNPATTDTTGAGDTFCACCLDAVLTNGLDMTTDQLQQMLRFANAAASLVTTRKGALRVMPERREVAGVFGA